MRLSDLLLSEATVDPTERAIRDTIKVWREEFKKHPWRKPLPTVGKWTIENGKLVHTSKELLIEDFMVENGKLAIPFKSALSFSVQCNNKLTTFENFPETMPYDYASGQKGMFYRKLDFGVTQEGLTSLEHFPRRISGPINTYRLPNLSLSKANKHIEYLGGEWDIDSNYVGPILSLILIKGLEEVNMGPKHVKLTDIINKHLKEKDVMECQEELIQAKLKEYARL